MEAGGKDLDDDLAPDRCDGIGLLEVARRRVKGGDDCGVNGALLEM